MSNETKNNTAWGKLFEEYQIIKNIEKNGHFIIKAKEINKHREARLMTKFDHKSQLPKLFTDNHLTILPVTRGDYVIGNFEAYKDFENDDNTEIEYFNFPEHIESIDFENITGEATAINCAYVSGILGSFLEENELDPTVSGRMGSGKFNFNINNIKSKKPATINITNSQIEIDGGFEGLNSLSLIEAKNSISDDFLIRQLYYPHRLWENKVEKTVRTIFMTYTNSVFSMREYSFEESNNYNSLILVKQKRYSLEKTEITLENIQQILASSIPVKEPKIAFPQADSFERVINICELLYEQGIITKDEITINYDFDARQTNYYTDAGRYLGLIEKNNENGIQFFLTNEGLNLFKLNHAQRQLKFAKLILQHTAFSKTLELYLKKATTPTKEEVVEIMKESNLYNIDSESTYKRRSSTILSWVDWILNLQK